MYVKLCYGLGLALLILLLLSFFVPVNAHADGGAPNLAYVAGAQNGVGVIDISQQKMTSTISAPGNPSMIQLSLDGRFLYTVQPSLGRFSILAARTGETICSVNLPGQPDRVTIDPGANLVFASGNGAARVTALDPTNCTIKHVFPTAGNVYGIAIAGVGTSLSANSGNQLWVSLQDSLEIFDDVHGQQVSTVSVPDGPRYVSIPPGSTVYATTNKGSVIAIDLNSHKMVTLISGGIYAPMDFDETTGQIYVPDQQGNQMVVLNPLNAGLTVPTEPQRTIPLGARPESIAITSDGQLGFVALDGGNVAMLDIPGHQLLSTIKVGGSPRFIITGLYPPIIGTTPQQASIFGTIVNVAAYVVVALLLIVPIILFRRYSKVRRPADAEQPAWSDANLDDPQLPPTGSPADPSGARRGHAPDEQKS